MGKISIAVCMMMVSCWAVEIHGADDTETAWQTYQVQFPIIAQNNQELVMRKSLFDKTHAKIAKHNSNKNANFKMGHNKFSVMTEDEKQSYLGAKLPKLSVDVTWAASTRQIATELDYRTSPCMPNVKDQGGCGSCWAFSATTVVEFQRCMKNGQTPVDLSEQQLLDCSTDNWGCSGGWEHVAWTDLVAYGGHAYEKNYPYVAKNQTCLRLKKNFIGAKIDPATPVEVLPAQDANAMMSVLTGGRILSIYIVLPNSFFQYGSGIFDDTACLYSNAHAINVVGYGSLDGIDYWVARNSWSANWGMNGYILIKRGVNLCLIEQYARTTNVL